MAIEFALSFGVLYTVIPQGGFVEYSSVSRDFHFEEQRFK